MCFSKNCLRFQLAWKKSFFYQKKGSRKNPRKINNNLTRFVFWSIKWLIWLTYCPSNVIGGLTGQCWNALLLLTSTIHSWISGFFEPGVGYRIVRVSGNDVLPKLCTAIRLPESNHGYTIVPTSVSLNDIYIICDPSSELQIASGVAKTSSAHSFSPTIKKIKRKDKINKLYLSKKKEKKHQMPTDFQWTMQLMSEAIVRLRIVYVLFTKLYNLHDFSCYFVVVLRKHVFA